MDCFRRLDIETSIDFRYNLFHLVKCSLHFVRPNNLSGVLPLLDLLRVCTGSLFKGDNISDVYGAIMSISVCTVRIFIVPQSLFELL